jgi:hypothetical protein
MTEDYMTPDKIPEPNKRIAFGAKPLPSLPNESNPKGRQLKGTASPGLSEKGVKPVVIAKGDEKAAKSAAPASTEITAHKTAEKIDTTPLAKRFKKK